MNRMRRMEIFKAVVEARQFSRAAENLSLSKSAVSHAISDLEAFLGTQLINRDNRRFQLTANGETYYRQCINILSEINAIESVYRADKTDIGGHISLTAPISFGVSRLSPILAEFLRQNPKVEISQSLSEHNIDLVQSGVDLAIRIGHLPSSALKARRLTTVQMVLIASPDFLAKHPEIEKVSQLDQLNTLRYRWTPKWRYYQDGKAASYTPKGNIVSDSGDALVEFTAQGIGVSFLPDFIVDKALAEGRVVSVLPQMSWDKFPVHIVFPPNRHRPTRINRLVEFLVEAFAGEGVGD